MAGILGDSGLLGPVPVGLTILLGAGLAWMVWSRRQRRQLRLVGTVSGIYIYPVKSIPGVSLEEALCTHTGLQLPGSHVKDRNILIATKDYKCITMRQQPSLARLRIRIHGDMIHIEAPDMEELIIKSQADTPTCTVSIFSDSHSAADCGDEAGRWISTFLGREGLRMCVAAQGLHQRPLLETSFDEPIKSYVQHAKKEDKVTFADLTPYMTLSDSSIASLNQRLDTGTVVDARSFRPNIVVAGCPPYDEDSWRLVQIGEARFSYILPSLRCVMTTVDPDLGVKRKNNEPLETLCKYRLTHPSHGNHPSFGTTWVLEHPGTIRVGDPIFATKA